MASTPPRRVWLAGVAALVVIVLWAWPRRTAPPVEEPPNAAAPAASATPAPPPPSPQPAEVQAKVEHLFGPVAQWKGGGFVAGDFNGDGWYDLAAVVQPRPAHLSDLNHELANWILQDPVAAAATPPGTVPPRPAIGAEPVLAIVHGFDPAGWRSPAARQTYVLKGVAGTNLEARPLQQALAAAGLRLRGDHAGHAIVEQLRGQQGFLYWTGARYVWAPLRRPA